MAWAKFPSSWIHNEGLKNFVWGRQKGDATAALVVLIALAIKRNMRGLAGPIPGNDQTVVATYDQLQALTGISRAKLAAALRLLHGQGLIEKDEVQSVYRLPGVSVAGGWVMLPQDKLMAAGTLRAFQYFTLRNQTELDALKIYMLILAMRSGKSGFAHIGHDKIIQYTGIQANRVKRAKSLLIANGLIHAENDPNPTPDKMRLPLRYVVLGLEKPKAPLL